MVLLVLVAGATSLPSFAWWRDSVTRCRFRDFCSDPAQQIAGRSSEALQISASRPTVAGTDFKMAAVAERDVPMCGVIGIVSHGPVNQLIYDGLMTLQHRGRTPRAS